MTPAKNSTPAARNDQVAADIRLFVRHEIDRIAAIIDKLQVALLDLAEREAETVMRDLRICKRPSLSALVIICWRGSKCWIGTTSA